MPYLGITDPATIAKLDDCVKKVMAQGHDKSSAIAICRASLKKDLGDDMSRQDRARAKKRRAELQTQTVKDLGDLAQAIAAAPMADDDDEPLAPMTQAVEPLPIEEKAAYPWDTCIADQMKRYGSRARAEKICGAIRARGGGKALELTPDLYKELEAAVFTPDDWADMLTETKQLTQMIPQSPALSDSDVARIAAQVMKQIGVAMGTESPAPIAEAVDVAPVVETSKAADPAPIESLPLKVGGRQMGLLDRLRQFFGKSAIPAPSPMQSFALYKDAATGRQRFVAIASNNFRDQDHPPQIITEAAHQKFNAYLDANPAQSPELWHWHIPGSRYGKSDTWAFVNGFQVYSGLIDSGFETAAERIAKDKPEMSHGFYIPVGGLDSTRQHINDYRTFEISTLPATRAANQWTGFGVIVKEVADMAGLTPDKRKDFVAKFGEEFVAKLENGTADAKAILDQIAESKAAGDAPVADANAPAADAAPAMDMTAMMKKMEEQLATLAQGMAALLNKGKEHDAAIKALQVSEDEKIAEKIAPRAAKAIAAVRPSQSPATKMKDGDEADEALKKAQPSELAQVLAGQIASVLK